MACADSHNWPQEHDRKLFEPSKDTWSLDVSLKNKLLRFGLGIFGGCRQNEGTFFFFVYSFMTSSPRQ